MPHVEDTVIKYIHLVKWGFWVCPVYATLYFHFHCIAEGEVLSAPLHLFDSFSC